MRQSCCRLRLQIAPSLLSFYALIEDFDAYLLREGDALPDLHLWRLGPGHLGAIVSIETARAKDCAYYRRVLEGVAQFSHLTVEVVAVKDAAAPRREVARAT